MRCISSLILLVCWVNISFAQADGLKKQKLDSLSQQLKKDSAHIFRCTLAKPYLRLENRYSFISREPVNLVGFLAGATFLEKHIICAGYYTLNRFTQKSIDLVDDSGIARREYLILNYFIFSYQYVLLNKRFLQINTPFEIGYGLYSTRTTDNLDNYLKKSNGNIVPISAGLQFIFKPVKWAGISCVGGYRHVVQEKNIDLHFKGFYYSFGLWIDARHVIRSVHYHFTKKKYRQAVEQL